MDGYEVLRQLRQSPLGDRPKILFCTTENDVGAIARALRAGADEYIMKPFDREIDRSPKRPGNRPGGAFNQKLVVSRPQKPVRRDEQPILKRPGRHPTAKSQSQSFDTAWTHARRPDHPRRVPEAVVRRASGTFARRTLPRCAPSHCVFDGRCLSQPG